MRTPRPALVLFLCVLIPASLSAQQSTTPAPAPTVSDPQAVAVLQKSLIAMTGGLAVTDATLTGSARRIAGSDDETGTATLKATSLGDSRVDLSFPSGNRVEIRNHSALPLPDALPPVPSGVPPVAPEAQVAGAWSGPDGAKHAIATHNIMTEAAWFFPALTLADLATQPHSVLSYVGPESLNGAPVIHIVASQQFAISTSSGINTLLEHWSRMDVYLDASSLLPVAFVFNAHPDDNGLIDIPTEIRFSNYQTVSGVQSPSHIQKFLNNGLVLDLELSSATLNSGLTASAFPIQ